MGDPASRHVRTVLHTPTVNTSVLNLSKLYSIGNPNLKTDRRARSFACIGIDVITVEKLMLQSDRDIKLVLVFTVHTVSVREKIVLSTF